MNMNSERFVSWLILDGWVAYRHRRYEENTQFIFFHKTGHRIHGNSLSDTKYRHGYQAVDKAPEPEFFVEVPWSQVNMHNLASLRRTMRKEGLL